MNEGLQDLDDAALEEEGHMIAAAKSAATFSRTLLMVLAGVSAAIALGGAWWLARNIGNGLRQATAAADRIARGEVDVTVSLSGRDELGQLGDAFRRMTEYLRESAQVAEAIAAGDLTVQVRPRSEHDALGNAFARMRVRLAELIGTLRDRSTAILAAAQQLR